MLIDFSMSQFNGNRMSYIRCIICIICCMLLLHAIVKTLKFLCPSYQHFHISWENLVRILVYSPSSMRTSGGKSLQHVKAWVLWVHLRSDWCFWPIKNVCCSVGIIPNGLGTKKLFETFIDGSIWVNYNISQTWIKAIWGWFPLLAMIPVRLQWGRYNLPRLMDQSPWYRHFRWINPIPARSKKKRPSSPWRDTLARAEGCWCCRCRSQGWGCRKPWPKSQLSQQSKAGITMS